MSSYPPGTWEGDPRAPWNEPDPWEGRECWECRFFAGGNGLPGFCLYEAMAEGAASIDRADPGDRACEAFEGAS